MNKFWKYALITLALLMGVRLLLSYNLVKTADRHYPAYSLPSQLKDIIKADTKGMTEMEIISYSTKETAKMLEFSKGNDIKTGKANCIGYANVCSSICRYAFKVNHIERKVAPVVGYVSKFHINLCDVLTFFVPSSYKGFVKDHDFVEVDMRDYYIYFDACLYDFTLDDGITYKAKKSHTVHANNSYKCKRCLF